MRLRVEEKNKAASLYYEMDSWAVLVIGQSIVLGIG